MDLRQRGIEHRTTCRSVRGQQARTGYWRKWDRREELRVIAPPMTSIGIRPAPIENIFAVAVRLRIKRHRADQLPVAPRGHETCLPAGFPRSTARLVQGGEESMREERMAWRESIPCVRIDGGQRHIASHDWRAWNRQWHRRERNRGVHGRQIAIIDCGAILAAAQAR